MSDRKSQCNPECVRDLAHHEWIADEARNEERDYSAGETRQKRVAASFERRPDPRARRSEDPDEQSEAHESQLSPEAQDRAFREAFGAGTIAVQERWRAWAQR